MAVKNRDQIGWLDCPMCLTRATVHECEIGRGARKAAKYYRCECGCIQPYKPAGQRFIAAHFEPMQAAANASEKPSEPEAVAVLKPVPETAPEYVPEVEPVAQETEPKPKKRGFFAMLLDEGE